MAHTEHESIQTLRQARAVHKASLMQAEALTRGLTLEEVHVADIHACIFTQWYHSTGACFKAQPCYQDLETIHHDFHQVYEDILTIAGYNKKQGVWRHQQHKRASMEKATFLLAKLHALYQDLKSCLESMENSCQAKYQATKQEQETQQKQNNPKLKQISSDTQAETHQAVAEIDDLLQELERNTAQLSSTIKKRDK